MLAGIPGKCLCPRQEVLLFQESCPVNGLWRERYYLGLLPVCLQRYSFKILTHVVLSYMIWFLEFLHSSLRLLRRMRKTRRLHGNHRIQPRGKGANIQTGISQPLFQHIWTNSCQSCHEPTKGEICCSCFTRQKAKNCIKTVHSSHFVICAGWRPMLRVLFSREKCNPILLG